MEMAQLHHNISAAVRWFIGLQECLHLYRSSLHFICYKISVLWK